VVDAGGAIRYANAAAEKLFQKPREQLLLNPFGFPLVAGETTELELTREGQPPRIVEMRVVESHWEESPAFLASLRDVTERKEAEENAQRLLSERIARSAAERSAQRMRFLADSLTVLARSSSYQTGLAAIARLCVRDLADWAVVFSVSARGAVQRLEVAHRDPALEPFARELRESSLGLDAAHPVHGVLRSRRPLLVRQVPPSFWATVSRDPRYLEIMRSLGVSSLAIVPMIARARAVGALALASTDPARSFDDDDLELIEDLAQRAALVLDNARLLAEAQRAVTAQSDLIAMVSHDLRTPLNSMLGYAELLLLGIPEALGDGARRQVERIQTSGRHLLYLIDQLTDFAKLDGDEQLAELDVRQLVREVTELVEPLARERGLEFRTDVDDSVGSLVTSAGRLRQVLLNLIGNAIKFTERGVVAMGAHASDAEVVFEVRDTGPGIEPAHLEEIFRPFWQAPGAAERGGGAGLGLSIVQRLVARLGGRIAVDSTPGAGSTFTVVLPRSVSAPGSATSERAPLATH
jgi:signal transduction histidine kinase